MCMTGHVIECVTSLNTSNSTKTAKVGSSVTRRSFSLPASSAHKERLARETNEMATPTRKSGKKRWVHGLFKVTQWGPNLLINECCLFTTIPLQYDQKNKTKKSRNCEFTSSSRGAYNLQYTGWILVDGKKNQRLDQQPLVLQLAM